MEEHLLERLVVEEDLEQEEDVVNLFVEEDLAGDAVHHAAVQQGQLAAVVDYVAEDMEEV